MRLNFQTALLLVTALCAFSSVRLQAQQMEVQDFAKFKPKLSTEPKADLSKAGSIIDFQTGENGFSFYAQGKSPVEAKEGEGSIRIIAPSKTSFILIKHPVYGQCTWKVPVKLRRHRHYTAYLATYSPDKLYKLSKQWLVMSIDPAEAIVHVDSTTTALVRDGKVQFNLPLGVHKYMVEAPFHSPVTDSVTLTETKREELSVRLQPFFSFITIRTGDPKAEVFIDREKVGTGDVTTGRIAPGLHRLTVLWDYRFYYDTDIDVSAAEKQTFTISREKDASSLWHSSQWGLSKEERASAAATDGIAGEIKPKADVTITAPDENTEIMVNREAVGKGSWKGALPAGFYAINTSRGGIESKTQFLTITDSSPIDIGIAPPEADYATLSIHSNVIGAEVFVNGKSKGETPCTVGGLPGRENCRIILKKDGYLERSITVKPHSNDLTDVSIRLKARKRKK